MNSTPFRRALVTGGAGFLGGPIVRALLGDGLDVVVLDDLSAGSADDLPAGASLVVADVRSRASMARAARACDLIVHLASVVGVDAVTSQPERTDSVIRDGTAMALRTARDVGASLVSFSSSEVTDTPRRGPRAVYAQAKRWGEGHIRQDHGDVSALIVRPFNVVGPGQSAARGSVVPALARAALRSRPLSVHGDGTQTRTFLHVDDLVCALMTLLAQPWASVVDTVEIGSSEPVSIGDLAERVCALAGTDSTVRRARHGTHREDRPRRRPDLTSLRRRIPFEPTRDLDRILTDVLASQA